MVLHPGRKGRPQFGLRVDGPAVRLTREKIADLFGNTTTSINIHVPELLKEWEWPEGSAGTNRSG